jgi:hypothetical protein
MIAHERRGTSRLISSLLIICVCLFSATPAMAENDPQPTPWPTIEIPGNGTGADADPQPAAWPTISAPDPRGDADDPGVVQWPAPAAG